MTRARRDACTGARALRVCLVSAAYHPYPSGISEHVSHLAGGLAGRGHDVHVLTTSYGRQRDDAAEPVPVVRFGRAVYVPLNGSYATFPVGLRLPRQVRAFLSETAFDIVHAHGVFWPEIAYWALRHSRAVNVVSFLAAGHRVTAIGSRVHRAVFARHLRRIHGRVAISTRAHQAYAPYVPGPTRIIPSGVDTDRFRPDLPPLPREERGRPSVLFVGRLDRRKGLEVLLRAFRALRRSVPGARLVVVGDGPRMAIARTAATDLGVADDVVFAGRVSREELPRYYAGCSAYCSPALGGESFGIVLLEAMAAGVPVVASDIPGYDETIDRGRTGLLVPAADPEALAAALARVLTDARLAASLAQAGLANAARHSWPRIAAETEAYYLELLAARCAGSDSRSPTKSQAPPLVTR